jgi:hypothetical protein
MGGGNFIDFDTLRKHRTHSSGAFGAISDDTAKRMGRTTCVAEALLPFSRGQRRILNCFHKQPIVCMLDVTGSMGDSVYVIYEKLGTFFLEIERQNYLDDPAISFAAVGDCYCDRAPLQVAQFSQSQELAGYLEQIYIEHGGGGQSRESYETMLYYYGRYCELTNVETPFMFIIGDEGFYEKIGPAQLTEYLGEPAFTDVPTRPMLDEVKLKFNDNVFLLHLPYGAPHEDGQIVAQWRGWLGENVIRLEDPTLVVEVMLGLIALTVRKRTIHTYLDDFRRFYQQERLKLTNPGQEDVEAKVKTMRQILAPYSQSIRALVKTQMDGALPSQDAQTLLRRSKN